MRASAGRTPTPQIPQSRAAQAQESVDEHGLVRPVETSDAEMNDAGSDGWRGRTRNREPAGQLGKGASFRDVMSFFSS